MKRLALILLLFAASCNGCEMWSTYAREHHCVKVRRIENTCWMTNTIGYMEEGNLLLPITVTSPYSCDDIVYRCDNGTVTR